MIYKKHFEWRRHCHRLCQIPVRKESCRLNLLIYETFPSRLDIWILIWNIDFHFGLSECDWVLLLQTLYDVEVKQLEHSPLKCRRNHLISVTYIVHLSRNTLAWKCNALITSLSAQRATETQQSKKRLHKERVEVEWINQRFPHKYSSWRLWGKSRD